MVLAIPTNKDTCVTSFVLICLDAAWLRAVVLLSAKTKWRVKSRKLLEMFFLKQSKPPNPKTKRNNTNHIAVSRFFFCSSLLRCDLLAKKVPGRAPYSQHIIIRDWTQLNHIAVSRSSTVRGGRHRLFHRLEDAANS